MNIVHHAGVDVSKRTLQFHVLCEEGAERRYRRFSNDEKGIAEATDWLDAGRFPTSVLLEPTGRYHRAVAEALELAGAQVVLLDPKRAHYLAKGLGANVKSDPSDAAFLAEACRILPGRSRQGASAPAETLKDLSLAIVATKTAVAGMKKSREGLDRRGEAYLAIERNVRALEREIAGHEKRWLELARADGNAERRYQLLLSIPNVGPNTARVLASELPEDLSGYRVDQVCSYAGVVPRIDDSGDRTGKAAIGKFGNAHIRTGAFMAAFLSSMRTPECREKYRRLRAEGKTHKQAVIALEHKLLRVCAGVLKRGTPWTETPPRGGTKTAVRAAEPLTS